MLSPLSWLFVRFEERARFPYCKLSKLTIIAIFFSKLIENVLRSIATNVEYRRKIHQPASRSSDQFMSFVKMNMITHTKVRLVDQSTGGTATVFE